ncbi:MAG: ATP-dependent metallopeptidase FtsH/Yme1/Tma family protein [Halobacteriovoraceae bacterium]|nr:ATP-dependent metallopeptidase FtsH/Yme1/Tma family protein [Halobacteriovoraceae bacterium]
MKKYLPNKSRPNGMFFFFLLMIFFIYMSEFIKNSQSQSIPYSQFKHEANNGNINSLTFKGLIIEGSFKQEIQNANKSYKSFSTIMPSIEDQQLIPLLEKHEVEINALKDEPGSILLILSNLLPVIIIIGFLVWSGRKMNGMMGKFNPKNPFGESGKKFQVTKPDTNFSDVAGVENAKKDLQEIIDYLKDPSKFEKVGAELPKGVLLQGPPGTGKTLLARASAGEANVPFFSISGSEFIELYVGMGASRVRELFSEAKKQAPSIIFIDEIDSVGRARGTGLGGGHDEREQTLNQILSEMDGFSSREKVVVMAATNRPDVLDSALVRPGRFDRQVTLDLPHKNARIEILNVHLKKLKLGKGIDSEKLAQATPGFSGADLKNLVNEAALLTARKNAPQTTMNIFDEARDKVVMGNPRENFLTEKDKEIIAVHEAGHALVAMCLKGADPVRKITIIPRGRALGFTEQFQIEERVNLSKTHLENQIAILLGGRIAEEVIFNEITTGAEDDLKRATKLIRKMIVNWGMSKKLGYVAFSQGEEHSFLGREMSRPKDFSESTAAKIDEEIQNMMKSKEEQVSKIINDNKLKLLAMSGKLMEQEILLEDEIKQIFS